MTAMFLKEYKEQTYEDRRLTEGLEASQDMGKIWRPWLDSSPKEKIERRDAQTHRARYEPYRTDSATGFTGRAREQPYEEVLSTFKHPVRLYWTKAAYDYMYESGEALLRNFPVQATIQIVDNYDTSDEEDEESDEDEEQDIPENK